MDHGKTALIRALTGHETDRLAEERERGMSIDLGFADFKLPSGRLAGVIDVPGHERFLKNMLAGAGGIDVVLLVIAADEGMMPQTREHLDILSILQTRRGVVVLTKADVVDEEWLELVMEDVRAALQDTFLARAPLVPVSSITGTGIPELIQLLDEIADEAPKRTIVGPWRLPIDRCFTVGGFGTVVTGTLVEGVARVGDRVAVLPEGIDTRIRTLQVHGQTVDFAEAGTRVAMNLAGLDRDDIERGCVATPPGIYAATWALDVRLDVLKSFGRELKNRTRVRVYLGAAEVLARLNLLDSEELEPGQSGLVQLRLESPTVVAKGDRFVVRLYSPMETIGGGSVIHTAPTRHRRFDEQVLSNLRVMEKGTPAELVAQAVHRSGLTPLPPATAALQVGLPADDVRRLTEGLIATGELVQTDNGGLLHIHRLDAAEHKIRSALAAHHAAHPMRIGMSREELRSRLARQMDSKGFNLVWNRLESAGTVSARGGRVSLSTHEPHFTGDRQTLREALERELLREPYNSPHWDELRARCGAPGRIADEVWDALLDNGAVIRLAADVFIHQQAGESAVQKVREYLTEHGTMTPAQFRDLLGTSRKFAMPLLEYLDARRVTRRVGDVRELI